jgi:hypothetical protein
MGISGMKLTLKRKKMSIEEKAKRSEETARSFFLVNSIIPLGIFAFLMYTIFLIGTDYFPTFTCIMLLIYGLINLHLYCYTTPQSKIARGFVYLEQMIWNKIRYLKNKLSPRILLRLALWKVSKLMRMENHDLGHDEPDLLDLLIDQYNNQANPSSTNYSIDWAQYEKKHTDADGESGLFQ